MFIKRAAILYENGGIIEGHDYTQIVGLARKLGITGRSIYGFTDSSDNFIDRVKALEIAKTANQVPEDHKGSLYPEDIFGVNDNAID